jgi:hypothetical protein
MSDEGTGGFYASRTGGSNTYCFQTYRFSALGPTSAP